MLRRGRQLLDHRMGLFSKTPKPNPRITVEGIEIDFNRNHEWWSFTYKGTEFCSFEHSFELPSKAELDAILQMAGSLRPEMRTRLQKGLAEWGDCKLDDGETCSVDLTDYAADRTFAVCWSGGGSWGDLGVEFTIKGQAIVDEVWGD